MFGSLPCLEDTDDDVKLNQSGAMLVYVAMKGGECGRRAGGKLGVIRSSHTLAAGAHPKSHGLQARVIMFVETAGTAVHVCDQG